MPTIAKIGRQSTMRGLAKSLFGDAVASREALGRAEAALLAANPSLGEERGFQTGRPVIVPDLQAGRATQAGLGDVLPALDEALTRLGDTVAEALASEPDEAKLQAETVGARATAAAVRGRYPDLLDDLPAIARAIAERGGSAGARYREIEAAVAQARTDLAQLESP